MGTRRRPQRNPLDYIPLLRRRAPLQFFALAGGITVATLAACVALVYLTGGTRGAFPHALYAPIGISAFLFGFTGSITAALIAGLAIGPVMPLDVASGEMQTTANWIYRLAFYLLAGIVFGTTASLLHRRGERLEDALRAVRTTQSATLKAFSSVVESHDDATGEHCERVAANARALGSALGLPREDLSQLYWAGVLHDVGKVAVPTLILHKPGALTHEEYELVKRHPEFGANLLRSISSSFEPVAVGVESHHERWDGAGYPHGLMADKIPLFGRILAIVDSFEAMTADRPYREKLPAAEAMEELLAGAGSRYDSELLAHYERLYSRGGVRVAGHDVELRDGVTLPDGERYTPLSDLFE